MSSLQEGEQEGKKVPLSVPAPMYQNMMKYVKKDAVNMLFMEELELSRESLSICREGGRVGLSK